MSEQKMVYFNDTCNKVESEMDIGKMLDRELHKIKQENASMSDKKSENIEMKCSYKRFITKNEEKRLRITENKGDSNKISDLQFKVQLSSLDSLIQDNNVGSISMSQEKCGKLKTERLVDPKLIIEKSESALKVKLPNRIITNGLDTKLSDEMIVDLQKTCSKKNEIFCFCGAAFPTYADCKTHAKIHSTPTKKERFECIICNIIFCDDADLKIHMTEAHCIRIAKENITKHSKKENKSNELQLTKTVTSPSAEDYLKPRNKLRHGVSIDSEKNVNLSDNSFRMVMNSNIETETFMNDALLEEAAGNKKSEIPKLECNQNKVNQIAFPSNCVYYDVNKCLSIKQHSQESPLLDIEDAKNVTQVKAAQYTHVKSNSLETVYNQDVIEITEGTPSYKNMNQSIDKYSSMQAQTCETLLFDTNQVIDLSKAICTKSNNFSSDPYLSFNDDTNKILPLSDSQVNIDLGNPATYRIYRKDSNKDLAEIEEIPLTVNKAEQANKQLSMDPQAIFMLDAQKRRNINTMTLNCHDFSTSYINERFGSKVRTSQPNMHDVRDMERDVFENDNNLGSESAKQQMGKELFITKTQQGGGICQICKSEYLHYSTCKTHYIEKHGESAFKNYACLLCLKQFTFELNLSNHMKKVHSIFCKLKITNEKGGLLAKTDSGGGVCLKCGNQYAHFSTCKTHFSDKHENSAPMRDKIVRSATEQTNQIFSHQKQSASMGVNINLAEKIACVPTLLPRKETHTIELPKMNNLQEISIYEEEYLCSLCTPPKKFHVYSSFEQHHFMVHNDKNYKPLLCILCKKRFNTKQDLLGHLKNYHETLGELEVLEECQGMIAMTVSGRAICLICAQTFIHLSNCKKHLIKHHNKKMHIEPISSDHFVDVTRLTENSSESEVCQESLNIHGTTLSKETALSPRNQINDQEMSCHSRYVSTSVDLCMPSIIKQIKLQKNCANSEDMLADTQGLQLVDTLGLDNSNSIRQTFQLPVPTSIENQRGFRNHVLSRDPISKNKMRIQRTKTGGGICLVCNAHFTLMSNCRVHYIAKHAENGTPNYNCLMCNAPFTFEQNLKTHLRSKHNIKDKLKRASESGIGAKMAKMDNGGAICLICGAKYTLFSNLTVHFKKKHMIL